jgi:hypothetical protein
VAPGEVAGELASAVILMVAGVGSAADLAPEESRRRLLLAWRRGLVAGGTGGSADGGGCSSDSRCGGDHASPPRLDLGFGAVEAERLRAWSPPTVLLAWLWPGLPSTRVCGRSVVLGPLWFSVAGAAAPDGGASWWSSAFFCCEGSDKAGE